jgi:hypothetical protein
VIRRPKFAVCSGQQGVCSGQFAVCSRKLGIAANCQLTAAN